MKKGLFEMTKINVDRPIFIIGTGRSGTTLLFKILHTHPDFAWPCQYMVDQWLTPKDRFVRKLSEMPVTSRLIKEKHFKRRYVAEPFDLWRKFDLGFNRPIRDLTAQDCSEKVITGMRNALYQQQERMGRRRFLTKYTGWSRIDYVHAIFPDAQFLHIIRDGRAVAWSLMQQDWWLGWQGPGHWRWGELSEENNEIWNASGRSFYVLAGLQWKILLENIEQKGQQIGKRFMSIRYEHFVNDPIKIMKDIIDWAGIKSSSVFIKNCEHMRLYNSNRNWENDVNKYEREKFEKLLSPVLETYGYA